VFSLYKDGVDASVFHFFLFFLSHGIVITTTLFSRSLQLLQWLPYCRYSVVHIYCCWCCNCW